MGLFSKPRQAEWRHTHFFELRDALEKEGCALCRLNLASVAHRLDGLAYEDVNDPGLRDQLRASRGFCAHHAWQFARLRSAAQGVAIIYRDVLTEVARILVEGPTHPHGLFAAHRRKASLPSRLLPQAPCPICAGLSETDGQYLGTLIDHLDEEDFSAVYQRSDGLCLPHLSRALDHLTSVEIRRVLFDTARRYLYALLASCNENVDGCTRRLAESLVGVQGALVQVDSLILAARNPEGLEGEKAIEELLPTGGADGCPVCHQVQGTGDRVLAGLPSDGYPSFPSLCNLHAWRFVKLVDHQSTAGRFRRELRDAIGQLTTVSADANSQDGSSPSFPEEWHVCPVEGPLTDLEVSSARHLVKALSLPVIQSAFRRSSGLCLPHLIQALRCGDQAGAEILAQLEADRIQDLVVDLSKYIRKQDYRFRDEPWGKELRSPWRAISLAVGAEGLRGVGAIWWPRRKHR